MTLQNRFNSPVGLFFLFLINVLGDAFEEKREYAARAVAIEGVLEPTFRALCEAYAWVFTSGC
jgi:hypothetical protein